MNLEENNGLHATISQSRRLFQTIKSTKQTIDSRDVKEYSWQKTQAVVVIITTKSPRRVKIF